MSENLLCFISSDLVRSHYTREYSWNTKELLFNFDKNKLCLLPLSTLKIKRLIKKHPFH